MTNFKRWLRWHEGTIAVIVLVVLPLLFAIFLNLRGWW
jgi:hypothetical protein